MSMRIAALVLVVLLAFVPSSFVALSGTPVHAQEQRAGKVSRIGFLRAGQPPKEWVEAFQQGLLERGYVDGKNVVIDFRFTEGSVDQLPQRADELVRSKVDVILASAGPAAVAAKNATTSIPIVFVSVIDPVGLRLVSSLARPDGNITGLAISSADLAGKRLELLRELVPKLRRVAVLWNPPNPTNLLQLKEAEAAAHKLGLEVSPIQAQSPQDLDAAFRNARRADGLLQLDSPFFTTHRARIVGLTAETRLPAIYGYREMVEAGGLMSYGAHLADLHRRAATYVDKILKGAKAADLPVEQPTKFELLINSRTAKTLGVTIPQSLLLRADQIVE